MKQETLFKALSVISIMLSAHCCTMTKSDEKIPVTTESGLAIETFEQGVVAHREYYVARAMELWEQALNEDPEFFRAAYQLSIYNLFFGNVDDFKKYSHKALGIDKKLSKGEDLMRQALEKLAEDPEADVTSIGKKLVDAYPNDYAAYYQLGMYYNLIGDYQGVVETFKNALNIVEDKTPVYNIIGYQYLRLEQYDSARKVFDTAIELSPELPNPYDSKGDYFMAVRDYENAYESYMKAVEIDSLFEQARNNARRVQMIMDSLEVN